MKEIIKEMKVYGQIFAKVRTTNLKGGVEYPILTLKPVATWITESTSSDKKKITANTKVSFSYYGLECKVSVSLLADATTLDIFESELIVLMSEAIVKAIEGAIVSGSGDGQPLGLTVDTRVPAGNKITLTAEQFSSYEGWKKNVFAKFKLAYRAGGSFLMASGTFEGHIDGMVDANGQPIGRVNQSIVDGPQERFGGRPVMLVEDDIIAPYDAAATGDVVAVFCKLSDYAINSNMQLRMFRWLDNDTNEWVDKAILICDGKILDANGVYLIKKG
jgi:HK97 family phage major capsid protein